MEQILTIQQCFEKIIEVSFHELINELLLLCYGIFSLSKKKKKVK